MGRKKGVTVEKVVPSNELIWKFRETFLELQRQEEGLFHVVAFLTKWTSEQDHIEPFSILDASEQGNVLEVLKELDARRVKLADDMAIVQAILNGNVEKK